MNKQLSLGEHVRRLRRGKHWQLQELAAETGLSVSHLSRIENGNVLPNAETVVKLAKALDGELELMLEQADCLPRAILERLRSREPMKELRRIARESEAPAIGSVFVETFDHELRRALVEQFGLSAHDAEVLLRLMEHLMAMSAAERELLTAFLRARQGAGR